MAEKERRAEAKRIAGAMLSAALDDVDALRQQVKDITRNLRDTQDALEKAVTRYQVAEAELAGIDAVMARRPALDRPTRRENVEKAIYTASTSDVYHGKLEAAETRVQALEAALEEVRSLSPYLPVGFNRSRIITIIDAALTEPRREEERES